MTCLSVSLKTRISAFYAHLILTHRGVLRQTQFPRTMFKLKDVKICYARSLYAYILLRRWKTGMGHNLTGDKSGGKKNSYHNHIWGTNFGGENFQIKKVVLNLSGT